MAAPAQKSQPQASTPWRTRYGHQKYAGYGVLKKDCSRQSTSQVFRRKWPLNVLSSCTYNMMERRNDVLHSWRGVSACEWAAARQSQGFYWSANYGRLRVLGGSQPSVIHVWQQCDTNDPTWQKMSVWLEADSEFEMWNVAPECTNHVNVWQITIKALNYGIDISSWHLKR